MHIVKSENGNIFGMLFAAVVMTGVLGVVGMQTVSGPVTTITKVTQKNMIDTDLMTNARIVILDAGTQPAGGDEDSDNYVEPAPFRNDASCASSPANGGCLPDGIGAVLTDPFGTPYGYCVWDHGSANISANRLQGRDDTSEAVIAVISAGADKTFQTSCEPFDGSGPEGLQEVVTSDDSVRIYTYDAAVAGANGLWQVKDGDPTVAQIAKNLEVGDIDAGTGFSFDTTTGEGDFPRIKTDIVQAKTGQNTDVLGGLRLDDQTSVDSCDAGDAGVLRYNSTRGSMEVCDGSDWNDTGRNWRIIDSDHGSDTYVTVAGTGNTNTNEIVFATSGTNKMVLQNDGRLFLEHGTIRSDNNVRFTEQATGNSQAIKTGGVHLGGSYGATDPVDGELVTGGGSVPIVFKPNSVERMRLVTNGNLLIGGTDDTGARVNVMGGSISLDENGNDNYGFVTQGSDGTGIGLTANSARLASPELYVAEPGRVGIGLTNPSTKLEVNGITKSNGFTFQSSVANHIDTDGALYRYSGQAYLGVDDNFYIRDTNSNTVPIHFDSNRGNLSLDGLVVLGGDTQGCNSSLEGAIRYNLTDIEFCNGTSWGLLQGRVDRLNDIGDVDVAGVNAGQTLVWSGSEWIATSALDSVSTGDTSLLIDDDGDTWVKAEADNGSDNDTLRFTTSNNERVRIRSNGRVGIGTTTPSTLLDVAGTTTSELLTVTNADGIAWESGVNRITHNDGGGNVQIRFGNDYTSGNERFTHEGGAMYIGGNIDSTSGTTLELKVSSNAGAGDNAAVAWGNSLNISANSISFGGADLTNIDGGNAQTIDGLNSTEFIRSNADDVVTANTRWNDNHRILLGSGSDFQMWHNGSDAYMRSYRHGARWLLQGENGGGTNRAMIYADPDNSVDLFYAGSNKLSTVSDGVDINGHLTASADLYANGQDVWIGTNGGGDSRLRLYDDNSNTWRTFYWDDNINRFRLNNNVQIDGNLNMNNDKIIGLATPTSGSDAANKSYVDSYTPSNANNANNLDGLNSTEFIRSNADDNVSGHTEWQDNQNVRLGSGADFRMWYNGTDTYFKSYAHGRRWILQGEDGGGSTRTMIQVDPDNGVNLAYRGSTKLTTSSAGIDVNGRIRGVGTPSSGSDAANKSYVDNHKDGDSNSSNELQNLNSVLSRGNNAGGNRITNLANPTNSNHAATKQYVDNAVSGAGGCRNYSWTNGFELPGSGGNRFMGSNDQNSITQRCRELGYLMGASVEVFTGGEWCSFGNARTRLYNPVSKSWSSNGCSSPVERAACCR